MTLNLSSTTRSIPPRAWLIVPAAVALLVGLDAALILLGVWAPVKLDRLDEVHGMLMVLGFVGTLIALERAAALRHPVGYAAPVFLGVGGLLLISPAPRGVGQSALFVGCLALGAVYIALWRRQRAEAVLTQALGVVPAAGAAALWLTGLTPASLIAWLAGFLVLTIAGERVELARVAMAESAGPTLFALAAAVLAGIVATLLWPGPGDSLFGTALLVLTGWLVRHDVARRTIQAAGLTRFMGGAMLAGYAWLAVAGVIWLFGTPTGLGYDAAIHAVFLGFAISMIMAHAPVILPALIHRPLPWHPVLWAPLGLLHLALLVRLFFGDAQGVADAWRVGGVGGVLALLFFAGTVVLLLMRGRQSRRRASQEAT